MKKIVFFILSFTLGLNAFSQLESKHGEPVLPKQGQWGVVADLTPLFRPIFNLPQNNPQHAISMVSNGKTLGVKYFLQDDLVLRAKVRIGYVSTTIKSLIDDDAETGTSIDVPQLDESVKVNELNTTVIIGLEKRRGEGRLQGIYGGETGILFGNGLTMDYTYANAISEDNISPSTSDFSQQTNIANLTSNGRILSQNFGYNFSYILRGFIGAEYFFLPKFSLGVEFAWGMHASTQKDGIYTEEFWDATNSTLNTRDIITRGRTSFGFDNYEAVVALNFYF